MFKTINIVGIPMYCICHSSAIPTRSQLLEIDISPFLDNLLDYKINNILKSNFEVLKHGFVEWKW